MTEIREFDHEHDSLDQLTALLHRSYRRHKENGLLFLAAHQTSDTTRHRISKGACLVLEVGGELLGTLTVCGPDPRSPVDAYRRDHTFHLTQFCVDPQHQGHGYGKALHDRAVAYAVDRNARHLALDTSVLAGQLIAMYEKWGYRIIGRHRWDVTNYDSVIMEMALMDPAHQQRERALTQLPPLLHAPHPIDHA